MSTYQSQSFNGSVLGRMATGEPMSVLDQLNAYSAAHPTKRRSMGNVGVKSLRGQSLSNSSSTLRRIPTRKQLKYSLLLENSN